MDLKCICLVKNVIEINYFWMLYASCNKVYNFGTCKHHGIRFINHLKCKPLLNISHIQT
jgi:hypothetical protein